MLLNIKSTALKFGDNTKLYLSGFSTVMMSSLILSGYLSEQTAAYYVAVGLVGSHIFHQVKDILNFSK